MHKFVRSVITEWRKLGLPSEGDAIVVAVSGGADSTSLLLALDELKRRKKLPVRIVVAHFNHRLRGKQSENDEAFVRGLAADLEMEYVTGYGSGKLTANLEEKARNERYSFLLNVAQKYCANHVLTAHTVNDQAETFLMNLIRGSGPEGLCGMDVTRALDDKGIVLIRPLLKWATRADTEQFCREQAVIPRTDEMNADERFTRVRIRRTILPALAEINPKIVETLARTASLMNHPSEGATASAQTGPLSLRELKSLSAGDLYSTLRSWLRLRRGTLRGLKLEHIRAIERLINSRKSGKTVELPAGGRVTKHGGELRYDDIKVEK